MDDHTMLGRLSLLARAVGTSGEPLTLAELTRRTALPKATVRRIAGDLVTRGALVRTTGGYGVGPLIYALAANLTEARAARYGATPRLAEIQQRTGAPYVFLAETTSVQHVSMIASVHQQGLESAARSWPQTGATPSVLATSLGRVLFAARPEFAESLLRQGIPRVTSATVTQPGRVLAALDRVSQEGFAVEHEQVRLGWSCVALPVGDVDRPQAVLGAAAPTHQVRTEHLVRVLAEVSAQISAGERLPGCGHSGDA